MPIKRVDHLGRTFASSSCVGIATNSKCLQEIPGFISGEILNQPSQHDPYHLTPYEWAMFGDGLLGKIDESLLVNLELKGASVHQRADRKKMHPFGSILHLTVGRGDPKAVSWALMQNDRIRRHTPANDWLRLCDANQRMPLHYIAMLTGYTEYSEFARSPFVDIAEKLIAELGVDFATELNRPDQLGLSPYLLAKKYGNTDILEVFDAVAKRERITITYKTLDPALHYTEKERRFLEHEAAGSMQKFFDSAQSRDFLSTLPNPFGLRPSLIALKKNNLKAFQRHLDRFSYIHMGLFQEKDPLTGNTLFLFAASHSDNLEAVVDKAIDLVELDQTNQLLQNALHLAVTQLKIENVCYLLKVLPKRCVWAVDFLGRTPLHLVALLSPIELGYDYTRLADFRDKQLAIVRLLQQADASAEVHDNFAKSALDYAMEVQGSDSALVKALHPKEALGVTSKVLSYCYGWWTRNEPALPASVSAEVSSSASTKSTDKVRPSLDFF